MVNISERTLKKWRARSLKRAAHFKLHPEDKLLSDEVLILTNQILRLTQELLDQILLTKTERS